MKQPGRTTRAYFCSWLLVLLLPSNLVSSGNSQSIPKPNQTDECNPGGNRICRLTIKITTRKERGAGTDNAVYLDIGPLSWRLNNPRHNDFEAGHTDQFDISPPDDLLLTKDDILWLRLQKKALFGFNGTGDGIAGAWHPERLVLIVNGVIWREANINEPLNSTCWFWRTAAAMDPPASYTSAANFARTLRLQPNSKLNLFSKIVAFATTVPKTAGISGWLKGPECRECINARRIRCPEAPWSVCASGRVFASAKSSDGLATIDLEVRRVEFCSKDGRCNDQAVLEDVDSAHRPRYLRVEYKYHGHDVPKESEDVRICGKLLWDSDKEGWWELHPRDCNDVTFISSIPRACTRTKHQE